MIKNPRVIAVKPLANYRLGLNFANGEYRIFDTNPYLSIGLFKELQEKTLFEQVNVYNGGVYWPNDLDFGPDTLYLESERILSIQTVKNGTSA